MIARSHSHVSRLREAEAEMRTGIGIGIETEGSAAGPSRANVPAELDDLMMVRAIGTTNPTEEGIMAAEEIHGTIIGNYSSLCSSFLLAVCSVSRNYLFNRHGESGRLTLN